MANTQAEGRFILDTAGSSLIAAQSFYVKNITVVSTPTSIANHTVITDKNDVVRFEWYGPIPARSVEKWWFEGFKLTVLDGGIVYVDVK